jgi:hypothetical protein
VKEFREHDLKIVFDDTWQCEKWDECGSYRQGIGKLQGSDAVDFLGIRDDSLYLIEVKGYRDYRIKNRDKHKNLPQAVAEKVRDTIAGVVGASIMRKADEFARECAKIIGRTHDDRRIRVIAWIIEDKHLPQRDRARAGFRRKAMRQQLRWLTTRVQDTNPLDDPRVPGVTVSLERADT